MFRHLTLTLALATASVSGSQLLAQTAATTKPVSATPNINMATYSRDYASNQTQASLASCPSCSTGGGGGYAAAGGAGAGYGYGGRPGTMAFGRAWGGAQSSRDCARFYHYPYVYYPQNCYGSDYYRSSDSLYHRYPPEMQSPVYNRHWHNYYPSPRRYHSGHHFITDVF